MIHVSAVGVSGRSFDVLWHLSNFFNGLARFAVPTFLLISGAFLMKPSYGNEKIRRRFFHMLFVLCFWSLFYCAVYCALRIKNGETVSLNNLGYGFFKYGYHLWYLQMLIGLYLTLPFLKKINESRRLTRYFLLFWFLFSVLPSVVFRLPETEDLKAAFDLFGFHLFLGYSGYLLLGYRLINQPLSGRQKRTVVIFGSGALLTALVGTMGLSVVFGSFVGALYGPLTLSVCLYSAAVFVVFAGVRIRSGAILKMMTECSFGIYLIHVFVMSIILKFYKFLFGNFDLYPLMIPLIAFIVYLISFAAVLLLKRIPGLRETVR